MKLDFYTTKRYTYIVADNVTFQKKSKVIHKLMKWLLKL